MSRGNPCTFVVANFAILPFLGLRPRPLQCRATHSHKNKICETQKVLVCPLVIALKVNHGKKRLKHYQSENLTINWNIL